MKNCFNLSYCTVYNSSNSFNKIFMLFRFIHTATTTIYNATLIIAKFMKLLKRTQPRFDRYLNLDCIIFEVKTNLKLKNSIKFDKNLY